MVWRVDAVVAVAEIGADLRSRGRPDRAAHEKAYLKSGLEHYGVPVPAIRAVARRFRQRHPELGHDDVMAVVVSLWEVPVHECRMAAVILLGQYSHRLETTDMAVFERLLRESRTWALVDGLAASVVGPLIERDVAAASVLDRWAVDEDFWIRRSALLALLPGLRRGEGEFERFARYADAMLDEKEFFVRKAIGWVLRETAKTRPTMVYDWLLPRARRAAGVTLREAVKPMSEDQRRAVLAGP